MRKVIFLIILCFAACSCEHKIVDKVTPINFENYEIQLNWESQTVNLFAEKSFVLKSVSYYTTGNMDNAEWCDATETAPRRRECIGPWFNVTGAGELTISNALQIKIDENDSETARFLRVHVYRYATDEIIYVYQEGKPQSDN